MKKTIKALFIPLLAVLFLNSCSASENELARYSSEVNECTPLSDILDPSNKAYNNHSLMINDDGEAKGIITWLTDKVTTSVKAATLLIYLKIALNVDFRITVAMMLTLAVMLFFASIILGLTQANGYNFLMFMLKLVIVYQLTINYYYFDVYVIQSFEALVTDTMIYASLTFSDYTSTDFGSLCLGVLGSVCNINEIIQAIFGVDIFGPDALNISTLTTGTTVFGAIDENLQKFFDYRLWMIIMALAFTGITGIIWAILLLALVVVYLMAIITAVKTFLLALIARYVLYGLGPIFISFALFSQTRSLFDGWLQQLINFTLQPVFLFIFLGMFHSVLAGFVSQLLIPIDPDVKYKVYCDPNDHDNCPNSEVCNQNDEVQPYCDDASKTRWWKEAYGKDACIKPEKLVSGSGSGGKGISWYRLCFSVAGGAPDCSTDNSIKPYIPIDLWMVFSAIVVCYLMMAMCHWVTQVAANLAGGMVTLSDTPLMGWDKVKHGIGAGVSKTFSNAMKGGRAGPTTPTNKP